MPVLNRIAAFQADMTAWRRHLHANPELGFETHETAAFVVERLREFGVDQIETGIGRTGVVAIIKGQGDGPVIGLRADMDALPIQEVRDLPHKSKVDGRMHACGHDGHTTMLLGAARYLAETRNFAGSVALIFQPAEEGGAGGREMVEDGLISRFGISQVFGLHNWPGIPLGQIETVAGPIMAAADTFDIEITGKGAHAAFPHLSVDPVTIGAQIVMGLQTLVARTVDPLEAVVVSVTQLHVGDTHNVIAGTAQLSGTVRTLDEGLRRVVHARLIKMATGIAEANGGTATVAYQFGYPVTVNHPEQTAFATQVMADVVGAENASDNRRPSLGAEDFSYMLEEVPGAYVFVGQGDTAGLHHPEYDFADDAAPIGASYLARLVEMGLPVSR